MNGKKITIKQIASMAGVSAAAVSGVLNNSSRIKCGQVKRKKILELVQKYNYAPNNNARALLAGRTGQIGFLVAEMATLGLGNAYYAAQLAGVERVVTNNDYLTTVSVCDLNDIDKFVFPEKLRRRSVDGLIVAGPVLPEIIEAICNIGVPSIICCDPTKSNAEETMQHGNNQLFLSFNNKSIISQAIDKLMKLGHRKVCLSSLWESLSITLPDDFELISEFLDEPDTFLQGLHLGQKWLKTSRHERFTALVGCDQICYGFLRAINSVDPQLCPREISVLCHTEMKVNKLFYPSISAVTCDPFEYGKISAEMLIDMLEKRCTFESIIERSKEFYQRGYELIVRESLGPAPD